MIKQLGEEMGLNSEMKNVKESHCLKAPKVLWYTVEFTESHLQQMER